MCTTMSGRRVPSSVRTCTCSAKSQCSTMPASSASRRSVSSPHWPRTSGRRSALTSVRVSFCSACCPSVTDSIELLRLPNVSARSFSMRWICCSVLLERFADRREQRLDRLFTLHQRRWLRFWLCWPRCSRASFRNSSLFERSDCAGHACRSVDAQPLDGLVERRLRARGRSARRS